jgi:ribonuclease-3
VAQAGERLDLGLHARLSSGERQHGGSLRRRLLADLYEAVAGAIYLDGGLEAAREFVRQTLVTSHGGPDLSDQDPKSALQELLQGRGLSKPTYKVVETGGPPHARTFLVQVEIDGRVAARGLGGSKREAEQSAARAAIRPLMGK